jgi:hypothetical protein
MIVKLLADSSLYDLKKGQVLNIPDEIAHELIAKGTAIKEKAINRQAHDALIDAKVRDEQQISHSD